MEPVVPNSAAGCYKGQYKMKLIGSLLVISSVMNTTILVAKELYKYSWAH